ncbi:MAG: hypothetical protein ACE5JU_09200 [Candidatus Binatia bacterium]
MNEWLTTLPHTGMLMVSHGASVGQGLRDSPRCTASRSDPAEACPVGEINSHRACLDEPSGIPPKAQRYELNMPFVLAVSCHEPVGSNRYWAIKLKNTELTNVWRALEAVGDRFLRAKVAESKAGVQRRIL